MKEMQIESFEIKELEIRDYKIYDGISDLNMEQFYETVEKGTKISLKEVPYLVKLILREILWVKLEGKGLEVHFGYDFYMYFCARKELEGIAQFIREKGLFIEDCRSPYLDD